MLSVRLRGNALQRAKHDLGVETEVAPELTQNWETLELQPGQLVFAEHPGKLQRPPLSWESLLSLECRLLRNHSGKAKLKGIDVTHK